MSIYNAAEIYQFAIRIEENGEKLYVELSEKFDNEELRQLFYFLSDEETKHRDFFINSLSRITTYEPNENFPEDYFAYLKAFADNIVFVKENYIVDLKNITTIQDAFDYAMKRELDTVHFFLEMKNLVPKSEQSHIDKIIGEEREHFLKLYQMKNKLSR